MSDSVSKRIERGIESKYFEVKYRPGKESKNSKLDIHCSSLLTFLALADISRDASSFKRVEEKFYQALALCQTEKELINLDAFLKEVARVGGYAEQFYSEVATHINVNGKAVAEQTLQKEKEEKRKPVSKRIPGGIESKYFGVKYRPGKESKNSKLQIQCSSLLTYLALADISRQEKSFLKAREQLFKVLSSCKDEKELREVRTFLGEARNIGGYATDFYDEVSSMISLDGQKEAQRYLQKIEEQKKNPVSKRIPGGIESKYFEIKYRPGRESKNFNLELAASSLLTYLALADTSHTENSASVAKEQFLKVLSSCKDEKELGEVRTFLGIAKDVGGYADEFYNQNVDYTRKGMPVVEQAKETLKRMEEQKNQNRRDIQEFNDNYSEVCERLEKAANSPSLSDEEIGSLMREIYSLQTDLGNLSGKVDKKFIEATNEQLERQFEWLKNACYVEQEDVSLSSKTY